MFNYDDIILLKGARPLWVRFAKREDGRCKLGLFDGQRNVIMRFPDWSAMMTFCDSHALDFSHVTEYLK